MQPFIKWPGGKLEELKVIIPNLPSDINRYIEPFVGGGAVYLNIEGVEEFCINDKSRELIHLYRCVKGQDPEFFNKLRSINRHWIQLEDIVESHSEDLIQEYIQYRNDEISDLDLEYFLHEFIEENIDEFNGLLERDFNIDIEEFIHELERNLKNKTMRMKKIEQKRGPLSEKDLLDNFEAAFKSGFYMYLRYLYNNIHRYLISKPFGTAIFYFIREDRYSSMFRYNKSGEFNVPYGGITYNRKNFGAKIDRLTDPQLVERLSKTTIKCMDFEEFLNLVEPRGGDFLFIDPPYDSDFSTYANNAFDQRDQERLANYLKQTKAHFMVVIKNTDFIYSLYEDFNIKSFDKKYLVSFQNRNDKKAEHLMITNY